MIDFSGEFVLYFEYVVLRCFVGYLVVVLVVVGVAGSNCRFRAL